MTVCAIIVAAGSGTRMVGVGPGRKQYMEIDDGQPVLAMTLSVFDRCAAVDRMVLVVPESDISFCRERIQEPMKIGKPVTTVPGGARRRHSVQLGLAAADLRDEDIAVIHDGVRPFVSDTLLTRCVREAARTGACIVGIPVIDTVKRVDAEGYIVDTLPREAIWRAQTPQAFRYRLIRQAHAAAGEADADAPDDAFLLERLGIRVKIIPGSVHNIKLTTPEDLPFARVISRLTES